MAITGAVGAALRQEAPYQAEVQMGAQLVLDFQGARSGGRPYYWHRGTRYADLRKVPGWGFSRGAVGYADDRAGRLLQFPANEPRITDKGLLVEGARTNALLRSQEIEAASWNKTDATITPDAAAAPDGSITADLVTEGSAGTAQLGQSVTITSGAAQVAILNLKRGNTDWVRVRLTDAGSVVVNAWFNLATGVAGTLSTAGGATGALSGVQPLANGFYRLWVSGVLGASTSARVEVFAQAGDGSATRVNGATYYVWQGDIQAGASPSSSIVTTTAAATRAADGPTLANLGAILTPPFTLVTVCELGAYAGSNNTLASINAGTGSDEIRTIRASATAIETWSKVANVDGAPSQVALGSTAGVIKMATRVRASDVRLAANGVLGAVGGPPPPSLVNLLLGYRQAALQHLNGSGRSAIVFGDLTDAQLQALTQ